VDPERALLVIFAVVMAELVALMVSYGTLMVLLKKRHVDVWRSLGSPWFGYMQSAFLVRPVPFVLYIRTRRYLDLRDTLTRSVGALAHFQLRFGAWVILALCASAAYVLARGF
jgi:hypothetical protein